MDSSRYSIASGLSLGRRRHNANQFNIMVCGHSLSGKSSFIRTFQHTLNIKKGKKNSRKAAEKKKVENQLNDLKIIDDENSSIAISVSPEMKAELENTPEIETFDFPPRNIIKPVASETLEIIEDG